MSDSVVRRFLFEHLDIRGAVVHLGDSWQQMQVDRDYQPTVAQLLGETAAVTALIAAQLKQPGRLTLQLRGNGPIQLRATYTWRSEYFTGVDRGDNMYVKDSDNLDISGTYNFTDNVSLTLAGMNLTDAEYYAYANTEAMPRAAYRTGRKYMATVSLSF